MRDTATVGSMLKVPSFGYWVRDGSMHGNPLGKPFVPSRT